MREQTIHINITTGLHARPAAQVVSLATKFKSVITALKNDQKANLKSLLALLSLGICQNDEITIRAEGIDENEAVEKLVVLINNLENESR